jgi:MoxR-like ATPase
VLAVQVSETIENYIVALIAATRRPGDYDADLASPRGTLALDRASRAHAWLAVRDTVTPEDVQLV